MLYALGTCNTGKVGKRRIILYGEFFPYCESTSSSFIKLNFGKHKHFDLL